MSDHTAPHANLMAELEATRARLAEVEAQIDAALNELGVPNDDYPASVANAVDILRAARGGNG